MSKRSDLIILTLGRVIQSLVLFLTYRELTHILPKSEVGLYFFLLAITGGIGLIIVNPTGMFFNRFIHQWQRESGFENKILKFFGFTLGAAVIASIVTLAIHFFKTEFPIELSISVFVFVLGVTLNNTFVPALNLLHFPRRFVLLTTLSQITTLLMTILAANHFPTAAVWLGVTGIVNLIFATAGYFSLRQLASNESTPASSTNRRLYSNFVVPLMLANIGLWFLTQGYRPLAQHFFGLEALAVIGLGLGLASSIGNAFETLIHQLYMPKFYQATHESNVSLRRESWEKLWSELVPTYFAIALFITGLSSALVRILSPTSYGEAWIYLSIGAWIEFFRMTGGLVSLLSISELKTKSTARPLLEAALIAFVLMLTTEWIALPILIGNIYALVRLSLNMWQSASLFSFSPGPLWTACFSLSFLALVFFRDDFNNSFTSFAAVALSGTLFLAMMIWNSSWRTRT